MADASILMVCPTLKSPESVGVPVAILFSPFTSTIAMATPLNAYQYNIMPFAAGAKIDCHAAIILDLAIDGSPESQLK